MKLSGRIFALAFANLLLLGAVFLAFAHYQFHLNLQSFLVAPAEDRVRDVARSVTSDLAQTPAANRTALMGRYAAQYGVDFYLFDNNGPTQLAGRVVNLPDRVRDEIARQPPEPRRDPPPRRADPPPPRDEDGPNGDGPPPERRPPPPPRGGRRGPPPPADARTFVANASFQTEQMSEDGLYWALTRVPVVDPDETDLVRGTLVIAAPSFWGTPLFFDFKPWLGAFAAAIAVSLICWLPFIRGLSRSISKLTDHTGRIARGEFENHLTLHRSDEVGSLAASIDLMADRLSGFVRGQKRFLGDIAHELSAPVARIQFALGILEQRTGEEEVEDLREEVRHMSGLIAELLSFSKAGLDAGGAAVVPVDVKAIAQQAIAREGAAVEVEIPDETMALAEPNLLLRALSNLLRNAIRYAPGGAITVSAQKEGAVVRVIVADSGPGLPPDELDRVFAPFYRPDTSRNRDTGGAGLGLAIVKNCVEASGGTVVCRNRQPHGLEVEIQLKAV